MVGDIDINIYVLCKRQVFKPFKRGVLKLVFYIFDVITWESNKKIFYKNFLCKVMGEKTIKVVTREGPWGTSLAM